MLIASAAALAALAWLSGRATHRLETGDSVTGNVVTNGTTTSSAATDQAPRTTGIGRRSSVLLGAGALLVLVVANIGIWHKENLIAHGQPVFIALAPVDPRSLMQGDYMRLDFVGLRNLGFESHDVSRVNQAYVVMQRHALNVAVPLYAHQAGKALGADQFLIELTPHEGRWMLVTDAWYFTEGEASRWEAAKYGDFRVLPNGQALLVGLADAELRPLGR